MDTKKKISRYSRIYHQIMELISEQGDYDSRLATIVALLHHKMDYFFWTGFYFLQEGELLVKTYQGPLACQHLEKNKGVCWAGINKGETIIVGDVHQFPGHIACDSRSKSEIVVPVKNYSGKIIGILDVDSKELNSFDETDRQCLEKIIWLLENHPDN